MSKTFGGPPTVETARLRPPIVTDRVRRSAHQLELARGGGERLARPASGRAAPYASSGSTARAVAPENVARLRVQHAHARLLQDVERRGVERLDLIVGEQADRLEGIDQPPVGRLRRTRPASVAPRAPARAPAPSPRAFRSSRPVRRMHHVRRLHRPPGRRRFVGRLADRIGLQIVAARKCRPRARPSGSREDARRSCRRSPRSCARAASPSAAAGCRSRSRSSCRRPSPPCGSPAW